MKTLLLASSLACASLLSFSSNAELVNKDFKIAGDGLTALDTESGLFWMDFSETKLISVNQIQSEFKEGGKYEGWRFATTEEVLTLMDNSLGSDYDVIGEYNANNSFSTSNEYHAAKNIINQLGITYSSWGKNYITGVVADPSNDNLLMASISAWTATGSLHGNFSVGGTNITEEQSSNKQSIWLVSDNFTSPSDVPVPAGLAFMSLSFLFFNKKKQIKKLLP